MGALFLAIEAVQPCQLPQMCVHLSLEIEWGWHRQGLFLEATFVYELHFAWKYFNPFPPGYFLLQESQQVRCLLGLPVEFFLAWMDRALLRRPLSYHYNYKPWHKYEEKRFSQQTPEVGEVKWLRNAARKGQFLKVHTVQEKWTQISIRLSVILSLSELKENRIWLGMIQARASLRYRHSYRNYQIAVSPSKKWCSIPAGQVELSEHRDNFTYPWHYSEFHGRETRSSATDT